MHNLEDRWLWAMGQGGARVAEDVGRAFACLCALFEFEPPSRDFAALWAEWVRCGTPDRLLRLGRSIRRVAEEDRSYGPRALRLLGKRRELLKARPFDAVPLLVLALPFRGRLMVGWRGIKELLAWRRHRSWASHLRQFNRKWLGNSRNGQKALQLLVATLTVYPYVREAHDRLDGSPAGGGPLRPLAGRTPSSGCHGTPPEPGL